uniref:Protein kinase domain-containing protein n=1 Tax=Pinguiococcus pyrenoidosus TaxID=172671 RepID=A0A7R9YD27_9STRA
MQHNALKKEEQVLADDVKNFRTEKLDYITELKRQRHEDRSRFSSERERMLNGRYLLCALLGKGGFSEVWRAYDLKCLRTVAVKVHQLRPEWSEERKINYTRHATREYRIHSNLSHPRVVCLFDVFEIDVNSFATVLEYCDGEDLDRHLKKYISIPERDARTWLLQILAGLKYLNTPSADDNRSAIIHYDLKPGNILFDSDGCVKITDFGLSKVIDNSEEGTSLELTSQGAGTYWYLPPECFHRGPEPPRISSKVDVFSLGVIYYQMLFGKRPIGDGMTQDQLLGSGLMLRLSGRDVEFPEKPIVSAGAKDFIRACLQPSQIDRPDIRMLCTHPYLRKDVSFKK